MEENYIEGIRQDRFKAEHADHGHILEKMEFGIVLIFSDDGFDKKYSWIWSPPYAEIEISHRPCRVIFENMACVILAWYM